MRTIYLDHSTTTPLAGSVREGMLPFLGEHFADPSSHHWMGRVSFEAMEDARNAVATLLHCHPSEIYFTSSGTESINLALLGAAQEIENGLGPGAEPHMIISAIEHLAVSRCAESLQKRGWKVTRIGCNDQGVVKLDHLESSLRESTKLISIMHVNHEIGTVQPIRHLRELCDQREIVLHTDACQSVGKLRCDLELLQVDMLSLSSHKMYGPKGVGALYVRNGIAIQPIIHGEYQESGLRPGMENVAGIAGLGQAARLAQDGQVDILDRLQTLADRFLNRLEQVLPSQVHLHGRRAERLPSILSLEFMGKSARGIVAKCPELCLGPVGHEGRSDSYLGMATTLAAMGVTPASADSTIRISLGWTTTDEEVDRAAEILAHAYESAS
ncbi:MAG: cysteine desulfurase family protein [Pirellulales bacterium]